MHEQCGTRCPFSRLVHSAGCTATVECFLFNINSGLKFRKFCVPNGTVHSGCTDLTPATARSVIVLLSRIQKSGTGDNNFVK